MRTDGCPLYETGPFDDGGDASLDDLFLEDRDAIDRMLDRLEHMFDADRNTELW